MQNLLHTLAQTALAQYDIKATSLDMLGDATNTIFQVDTLSGDKYALRICTPGWRTISDIQSEIIWLQALAKDTDIGAPRPIASTHGETLVAVAVPDSDIVYQCLLMSWLPGTLLAEDLTEHNLYLMGQLFARLHQHTDHFRPSTGFTTRKMNNIYARGEEDVLFSATHHQAFSTETLDIFQRVMNQVTTAFAELYQDAQGLRVIHNDLHHENIKIDDGVLRPFDFEDTIWGYAVQDIAMALQDLMMDVKPEQFSVLKMAFRHGYESLRQWPEIYEGQIDTFRVGRMLWVANYVARYQTQFLEAHINQRAKLFARYLETGILCLD